MSAERETERRFAGAVWPLVGMSVMCSVSCARMYAPPPMHLPLMTQQGATQLSVDSGYSGAQLAGAYALTDKVVVRARSVGNPATHGMYGGVGLGIGYEFKPSDEGPEPTLATDDAMAAAPLPWRAGISTDLVGNAELRARAELYQAALQGYVATDWPHGTVALALRFSYVRLNQTPKASPTRQGRGLFAEPALVVRAGPSKVKAQLQVGLSAPLWRQSRLGSELPLFVSAGVVYAP